jgi:hypothetical protein
MRRSPARPTRHHPTDAFAIAGARVGNSLGGTLVYCAVTAAGVLGVLTARSLGWARMVPLIIVAYAFDQILFAAVHTSLHRSFCELEPDDLSMSSYLAFVHHRGYPRVFSDYWLMYRLIYFVGYTRAGAPVVGSTLATHVAIAARAWWVVESPAVLTAFLGLHVALLNVQAVVHEWYHVPKAERAAQFAYPTFVLMSALEEAGLADSVAHRKHHATDREDDPDAHVEDFFDLWAPAVVRRVVQWYYAGLVALGARGVPTRHVARGVGALAVAAALELSLWLIKLI